jgi:hypothetical protein
VGRIGYLALFALLLSGCVSTPAIDDQQKAIAIASNLCASTIGKALQKQGGSWEVRPSEWQARLDGSSWKVWTGKEASPVLLVHVPRTGQPPTACDMHFED